MYTAKDLANWFLAKESMTPKKLQKMLYYAYAWTLTLTNEKEDDLSNKLFPEKFEAWVHGPVIPEIYHEYKRYGYTNIPKQENTIDLDNKDIESILDQVMLVYGKFDGNELESITHQEEPWNSARIGCGPLDTCNNVIDDVIMYKT
ncbi:SocA family protein, partial [Listeria monocytogenes]|nr:SocA family protein [Listeria monocytogenes]EGQ1229948.1 SocA family protein [Listeria monocytogenes]